MACIGAILNTTCTTIRWDETEGSTRNFFSRRFSANIRSGGKKSGSSTPTPLWLRRWGYVLCLWGLIKNSLYKNRQNNKIKLKLVWCELISFMETSSNKVRKKLLIVKVILF